MNENETKLYTDGIRLARGLPNDAPTLDEELLAIDAARLARAEFKTSPAARREARDRKRKWREREREKQEALQEQQRLEQITKAQKQKAELDGLSGFSETAPGISCQTIQEQLQIAIEYGRAGLGPFVLPTDTYRSFVLRVMNGWVRSSCPLLKRQSSKLGNGDVRRLFELAGVNRSSGCGWMYAAQILRDELLERYPAEQWDALVGNTKLQEAACHN